jgi:hypothetical protein
MSAAMSWISCLPGKTRKSDQKNVIKNASESLAFLLVHRSTVSER